MINGLAFLVALTLAQADTGAQADTLRLSAAAAVEQALMAGQGVRAALARQQAATATVKQAGAWRNPSLLAVAENLGAETQTSGVSGLSGVQGQLILAPYLTIGGDRGAAIAGARALQQGAVAAADATGASVRAEALAAIALVQRDAALAYNSRDEAAALERFAHDVALRAAEGRASGGEAARAGLEATLAATNAARRRADLAGSSAQLTRLLGLAPGAGVSVETPRCGPPQVTDTSRLPELRLADAQSAAATAAVAAARARAVPDLQPQAGLRRLAGVNAGVYSALQLGFSLDLPVFNFGHNAIVAAKADSEAVAADRMGLERQVAADRGAAEKALAQFDLAGQQFTPDWDAMLRRTVTAATARYEAGEATLAELLDSRRARLTALDDFARWRAERRLARIRLARLAGASLDAALLCDDPGMEMPQ